MYFKLYGHYWKRRCHMTRFQKGYCVTCTFLNRSGKYSHVMLEIWGNMVGVGVWSELVRWPLCMSSGVWVKVPANAGAPPPNRIASSHQPQTIYTGSRWGLCSCLLNHLGAQRLGRLEHVQQLRVVYLQQHACDLPCQVRVHVLDQREETLTWKEGRKGGGDDDDAGQKIK